MIALSSLRLQAVTLANANGTQGGNQTSKVKSMQQKTTHVAYATKTN